MDQHRNKAHAKRGMRYDDRQQSALKTQRNKKQKKRNSEHDLRHDERRVDHCAKQCTPPETPMTGQNQPRLRASGFAALLLGFAFLYAPIGLLAIYSFNASKLVSVEASASRDCARSNRSSGASSRPSNTMAAAEAIGQSEIKPVA